MSDQDNTIAQNQEETRKMNVFYKFFCWCSGAQLDVLKSYPTEWDKYFGTGIIIFLTGVFAGVSSAYALSSVFKDVINGIDAVNYSLVIPIAILWGMFIFFLDRFFISSMSKGGSNWQKFWIALPRLIIAFFLGIIISRPLELRFFQSEIKTALISRKGQLIAERDSLYRLAVKKIAYDDSLARKRVGWSVKIALEEKTIREMEARINQKQIAVEAALKAVECECRGICGTGIRGDGPACKDRRAFYEKLAEEYRKDSGNWKNQIDSASNKINEYKRTDNPEELEIINKTKEKEKKLKAEYEADSRGFEENYTFSLLDQNRALSDMSSGKNGFGVLSIVLFLTILFIFIEMAPVITKFFTKSGSYEDAIEQQESEDSLNMRQRRFTLREEYKTNKGLIQKMTKSQRNIIRESLRKWEQEELSKARSNRGRFNNDDES